MVFLQRSEVPNLSAAESVNRNGCRLRLWRHYNTKTSHGCYDKLASFPFFAVLSLCLREVNSTCVVEPFLIGDS